MADFVAVLRKTIDGLADNTPDLRAKVYDKARATVAAKLAAINPPPPAAVAERQKQVLEDAIRDVEASYSGQGDDPFAELENVFSAPPTKDVQPATAKVQPARPEVRTPPAQPAPPPSRTRIQPALQPLAGSQPEPEPWPGEPRLQAEPELEPVAGPEPFDGEEEGEEDGVYEELPERRRSFMPLIAAAVVLALLAGGGYAVWLNKNEFMAMLGIDGTETVAAAPSVGDTAPVDPPPATAQKSSVNTGSAEPETPPKYTQRLNSDGTEIDPGPAGGIASIGEGTTVAAATQLPAPPEPSPPDPAVDGTPPADAVTNPQADATTDLPEDAASNLPEDATTDLPEDAAANPPVDTGASPPVDTGASPPETAVAATDSTATTGDGQVAVSQKAIFYEERTSVDAGSAQPGNIVWTLVQESPGDGQPEEPAIHGEVTIPGKDFELRITIRRNADKTLPASHIIELIFLVPENFDGGGIDKVLRVALKPTEEDSGNQLLAIAPAKVAPGYFLVALSDTKAEIDTNLRLLRGEQWIDVPLVYANGRRALITMEKGVPGDKVFDEVIKAWQSSTSG